MKEFKKKVRTDGGMKEFRKKVRTDWVRNRSLYILVLPVVPGLYAKTGHFRKRMGGTGEF